MQEVMEAGATVQLSLSASALVGAMGSPDPVAVLFFKSFGLHEWKPVGETEAFTAEPNPQFERRFTVDFHFELYQEIRVVVFDRGLGSEERSARNMIGMCEFLLASLVVAPGQTLEKALMNKGYGAANSASGPGRVKLTMSEVCDTNRQILHASLALSSAFYEPGVAFGRVQRASQFAEAQGAIKKLEQRMKSTLGMQQPLFPGTSFLEPVMVFFRHDEATDDWQKVYETSPVYSLKHSEVHVTISRLCGGDLSRPILIVVKTSGGDQKHLGSVQSSVSALQMLNPGTAIDCDPAGSILFHQIEFETCRTFLEFFTSGSVELALTFAIDLTSSNKDPRDPTSLHFLDPSGYPNEYEAVMRTLVNILLNYCSGDHIKALGFGANVPPSYNVSHCFPLSFGGQEGICTGVEGLIRTYRETLAKVFSHELQLYGPTVLSEVIRHCANATAQSYAGPSQRVKYELLVVLTDGVLSDPDSTTRELIQASKLPMSVAIVGVGPENFSKARWLDASGDDGGTGTRLRYGNQFALRDTTQFVQFSKYEGNVSALAADVLRKIPVQIAQFMQMHDL